MAGISFDKMTIDKIIDLVELLQNKGDETSIKDIHELQVEWEQSQYASLTLNDINSINN